MFTINQIIRSAGSVNPGQPAIVNLDGSSVSYAQFADGARRVAGGIAELAPKAGDSVGILALNSTPYLEIYLGAMWAGRVAVPLNLRWSVKELVYAIEDANIEVLFVDDQFAPLVPQLRAATSKLRAVVHFGKAPPEGARAYADLRSGEPLAEVPSTPDTLATVVYTSGTTGSPKGVMHTHGSMLASSVSSVCMGMPARGSRYLVAVPLFHLGGYGLAFAHLLQGGTLVPAPLFRPDLVVAAVTKLGVDFIGLVPTMLGMLMDAPEFKASDFAGVKGFAYGASPMPTATLQRVMKNFPQATLTQLYGMTEVGLATLLLDRWHREPNARITAAGQPGPFYSVRIVDDNGKEVAPGQKGEVVFHGPAVMKGYLNKPKETAEALRGGGMHSGDAGVMDADGVITLLDRVKDMIVTGAENVYSVEVENVIAKHPAVVQCAVIGIPDDKYGEAVHAVVVLKPGTTLEIGGLREFCAEHIAGYKCPRSMEVREAMPLSAMAKILKAELRAPHWAGRARKVN